MKVGDQGGQAALPYCVLSARELWTQLGGFRSGIGAGTEIWDFWLRCFGAGSAAVLVDAPWVYARSKSARLSRDGRARLLVEHPHCFDSVEVDAARSQGRPAVSSPGSVASPSVSVIVACHNYGQYLERAVASVLAQSYRDFEIIIVDDGSSDDSVAVARKIIERNLTGVPIRLLQLDDVGPSEARRRGVGESAGRYFLPLDADDRIAPEFLERTVPVLEANEKLGFAYVDTVYFGDQERRHHQPEYDFKRLCAGNFISYASLVRRAAFDSVDGYDRSNWGYYEDWDLWIRLGKAGWFGKHVPEPLFFYHQHFSSSLSFYSRRLDPVYRAFVIASNAALYPPSVRAKADAILAEMPTGWHRSPPLRELAKIRAKLERFPGNRHVRFFLAIALQRSGDLTGAMRVLEELARDYPADDLVRVTLREFASSASLQRDEGVAPVTSGAPLVSVVVPCFNQAQFLQEALGSVVAQSFSDWEVIIVNDGSPDDTSAVAKSIMAANPRRRIRLIEKANGGLADARNAGISFARGKYILPLDADDRVHPNAVKKMVALLEANPGVGIAYCDWQYFGADDRVRNAIDYDFKRLCSKENLFTCTSMFRKSAWEAVGGFNINMTHGVEDWDFWISCGEKGFVGRRIPEVLFYYRSKPGSMIRTLQPHLTAMFARIVMNHPALYGAAAVDAARVIFERAGLPGPKPSMPGTEWSSLEAPGPHEMGRARESAVQPAVANGFGREVPSTGPVAVERVPGSAWSESDGGGELDALIRRFAEDPSDPAVRSALLKIRRKVHAVLRHHEADPQHLERLFAGSLGRAFRSLAGSGICLAVEREDQVEAAQSLAGAAEDLYLPRLLACIIAVPAHRIAIPMHLDRLPVWCIDDVLAYLLAAPQVLVIAGEADQYLDHHTAFGAALVDRIKAAPADPLTLRVARAYVEKINCIPCYTASGNTLPLMRCRAAAIEFVLERNGAVLDATFPRPSRRKIRVGFLSAHFGEQTETHVTLPALHLDRSRFEVLLFPLHTLGSDLESRCRSLADQFVPLPQGLGAQVARLREAALDVLIIGTNVTAVTNQVALLAAHRLASVQLVSYCSPMSTGLRNVDGYLFGHLSMFSQVEEHFSEKLVVCEGAPGCLDYTYEKPGSMGFDRKSLGIGQSEIVFVNAASCYKVPLELQETWAKLLQRVPGSRLLLLPFNPNWSNRFPARLFGQTIQSVFAAHGVSTDRLILANPLPSRNDVKAIERLGDIYLDTFPFSGSLSVIDPLEIGLPVVAWQGRTPRSRAAASLLRAVGLEQLIANEEPEYLGLAERLARDTEYRNTVAATVRKAMQSKPRFLDPSGYGRDLSNVLEAWVQRKRSEAQRQRSSEVASVF